MSLPVMVISVLGAVFCGYWLGRARPWQWLGDWAEAQVRFEIRRTMASWWRMRLVFAAHFATQPRATWHAWRHRNDPLPERETVTYDPTWTNRPTDEEN